MGSWRTKWSTPPMVTIPTPPGDYRDMLPPACERVYPQFAPVVQDGQWTHGLIEMWGHRVAPVKAAVHVPCWESYRLDCRKWRGWVCGRTGAECVWYGTSYTRWARTTLALGIGREYSVPCKTISFTGIRGQVCALCWCIFAVNCLASCGIAHFVSCCGFEGLTFAACYTCHAREKLRRKFKLPTTCGLPDGIDDCCVHFWCLYCASHQEMREVVMRGLDGPGLHALDVHPQSWEHLSGYHSAVAARQAHLKTLEDRGVLFLPFEQRMAADRRELRGTQAATPAEVVVLKGAATPNPTMSPLGEARGGHAVMVPPVAMDMNQNAVYTTAVQNNVEMSGLGEQPH